MSNYTQTTFFAPKDSLLTGNPAKLIRGADVDPELAAIAAAIATKLDTGNAANPSATIGLSVINGTAGSYMRSDGAPALSQAIVPTWTGIHTFSAKPVFSAGFTSSAASTITAASGIAQIISGVAGGDIARWTDGTVTGSFQTAASNGYVGTTSNHTFNLVSNNATRVSIANSGAVVVNSPTSGNAFTVNTLANSVVNINSGNASNVSFSDFQINRSGSTANSIQQGPGITLNDSTNTTVSTLQHSGGQTELWQFNGSWTQILKVSSAHLTTVNTNFQILANASGTALSIVPTSGNVPFQMNNGGASGIAAFSVGSNYTTTGASTPTLGANKPGSNAAVIAWMQVLVNSGATGWIPVFGN